MDPVNQSTELEQMITEAIRKIIFFSRAYHCAQAMSDEEYNSAIETIVENIYNRGVMAGIKEVIAMQNDKNNG